MAAAQPARKNLRRGWVTEVPTGGRPADEFPANRSSRIPARFPPAARRPLTSSSALLPPTLGKGFVKFPLKFCDCAVEGENFPGKYMLLGQESGALNPRAVIHFPGRQNGHFERSEVPTISLYQPG